jgi:hypothetical protein
MADPVFMINRDCTVDPDEPCIMEYEIVLTKRNEHFIKFIADRQEYGMVGPYDTQEEAEADLTELMEMMRSIGATDIRKQ